jgi:hypothetical protein
MANTPNSSDNGNKPNQIGDFGLSRLAEIAAENRPSAKEAADRAKARVAREGLRVDASLTSEQRDFESIAQIRKSNINTMHRTEPRIRIAVEARQQRLSSQAVNAVSKEFSESTISGMINELSSSPEAQHGAMSMMGVPYNDLVAQQRSRMARLQELGAVNKGLAGRVIGRKGINQDIYGNIQANTQEAQGLMNELGTISAALGQQKAIGNDPRSRAAGLVQDVAMAKGVSSSDSTYESAQTLIKAFERLSEVTDVTSKEFLDLQKTTDEARKNFVAGGSGGGSRFANYAGMAQAGFGAFSGAVMQIGVNQKLAQAQNATGFADWENQKYQTYKAAAGGDIASLMRMSQFTGAEAFGIRTRKAANLAVGSQMVGGLAGAVGSGAVDDISGSIGNLSGSAVALSDYARNVSGGQAEIAARQARLSVANAVNAVGAEQIQGFRDFSVGLGTAAIGMGSSGGDFLRRSISGDNMSRMTASRISPEQMVQMTQMGVANMGSMFNENQIFEARNYERRGLGSMGENMQRMAGLAAAGSNNPSSSLSAITEAAITRGLDSSKALNAVVDHTASMAASTAGRAMGLDTTAASATLLMAGVAKDAPNKEAAIEHAAAVQDIAHGISANIGANYAGMSAVARTQRTLGVGGPQAIAAQLIDVDTLKTIQGLGTPGAKAAALRNKGVNVAESTVDKSISGMLSDAEMKLLEAGGKGIALSGSIKGGLGGLRSRLDKAGGFGDLSPEDQASLGLIGGFSGMKGGGKDMFGVLKGVNAEVGKEAYGPSAAPDKMLASLDKLRTTGFEQLATAAQTGAAAFGGAAEAVDKLTTAFDNLAASMPKIEGESTTSAGRATASGRGMNVDVTKFNGAIDKLDAVLNKALKNAGVVEMPREAVNKNNYGKTGLSHP